MIIPAAIPAELIVSVLGSGLPDTGLVVITVSVFECVCVGGGGLVYWCMQEAVIEWIEWIYKILQQCFINMNCESAFRP